MGTPNKGWTWKLQLTNSKGFGPIAKADSALPWGFQTFIPSNEFF